MKETMGTANEADHNETVLAIAQGLEMLRLAGDRLPRLVDELERVVDMRITALLIFRCDSDRPMPVVSTLRRAAPTIDQALSNPRVTPCVKTRTSRSIAQHLNQEGSLDESLLQRRPTF